MTLDEFFAEAKRLSLTAADVVPKLTMRPEFEDCLSEDFREAKATIMAMPEQDLRSLAIAQLIQLRFHEKYGNAMQNAKAAYRAEQSALGVEAVHNDHPLRNYDRTCPACNAHGVPEPQPAFWESGGDWTDDPHVADGWKLEVEAGVRSGITPLYTYPHDVDACATCGGKRGGVPGNENLVDGKLMCDYCHGDLIRTHGVPAAQPPTKLPGVSVALNMCREANMEARLPTPMCWDLALYVKRLEDALGVKGCTDGR